MMQTYNILKNSNIYYEGGNSYELFLNPNIYYLYICGSQTPQSEVLVTAFCVGNIWGNTLQECVVYIN